MEDRVSPNKIRASLRWLVFTAYQNNPPQEIRDPIYKDYNQEDKIKPQIVHKLSTAELYALVLSVLYKDPNMQNLNNWGVIQVLGRKGVDVRGQQVTETTLMQTSPIRITQHCAVIDALMTLYLRETMMSNGVSTIKMKLKYTSTPDDIEEFIVSWMNHICQSLKVVLEDTKENKHKELPKFEKISSLDDVKDGSYILAVFSYFHPQTVPWTDIDFSRGNKSAAFNNFNTIKTSAKKTLPYDIMHIQFIDLFNSEVDMRRNILCFLLDMITRLEFGGVRHQERSDDIEDDSPETSYSSPQPPPIVAATMPRETRYVLHEQPKPPRMELQQAAGVPSQRGAADVKTFAGRRSSKYFADANQAQISIENIGGSVENISTIGRNPDKELRTHTGRRTTSVDPNAAPAGLVVQKKNSNNNNQTFDIRSLVVEDDRPKIHNGQHTINTSNYQPTVNNVQPYNAKTAETLREKMFYSTNFLIEGADDNMTVSEPRDKKVSSTEMNNRDSNNQGYQPQVVSSPRDQGYQPQVVSSPRDQGYQPQVVSSPRDQGYQPQVVTSPRDHIYSRKTSLRDLNNLDNNLRDNMQGYSSLNSNLSINTGRESSEPPSWSNMHINNNQTNYDDPANMNNAAVNDHLDAVKRKLEMRRKRIESEKRKSYISPSNSSLPSMDSMEPHSGNYMSPQHQGHQNHYQQQHNQQQQQQPDYYQQQQPQHNVRQQQQQNNGMSINDLNEQISSLSKNLSLLATQQDQLQEIIKNNNEAVIKTVEPLMEHRRTWGKPMPIDFGGSLQNLRSLPMYQYGAPVQQPPPLVPPMTQPPVMQELEPSPYNDRLYSPYHSYQPPPPSSRLMQRTYSYDMGSSGEPVDMPYYTAGGGSGIGGMLKKVHCPVDAPRIDDMAPQNISFIENVNDDDDPLLSPAPTANEKKLSIDSTTSEQREQKRLSLSSSFNDHKRNSLTNSTFKIEDEDDGTSATIITKPLGDGKSGFIISFDDDKDISTAVKKKSKSSEPMEPPPKTPDPVMIMLDMNEDTDSSNMNQENTEDDSNNFDSPAGDSSLPHSNPSPTGMHINNTSKLEKSEMDKKKEKILLLASKRKQMVERNKRRRMEEAKEKKEKEEEEAEEKFQKKLENEKKREAILEAHRNKKEQKSEDDSYVPKQAKAIPKLSSDKMSKSSRQSSSGGGSSTLRRSSSRGNFNSLFKNKTSSRSDSMSRLPSAVSLERLESKDNSPSEMYYTPYSKSNYFSRVKNDPESVHGSRDSIFSRRTYTARHGSNSSLDDDEYYYNDYMAKYHGDRAGGSTVERSGGGSATKERGRLSRQSSTKYERSPIRYEYQNSRYDYDDCNSEISSTSGWSTYDSKDKDRNGGYYNYAPTPVKSNRSILMNAIEYVVFPGAVNKETRKTVLEEIDSLDCPHFLILFRDFKFQFRGLYAYYPDTDEVFKIYGTGPKQIQKDMFESFYKYNSSGKKFTQVHTKALTVTIDAFIIKNSLWLGKRGTSRVRKPSIGH